MPRPRLAFVVSLLTCAAGLTPGAAHAWELELGVALEGGAAWHYERTQYSPFERPPMPNDLSHDSAWTPTGALQLSLSHRVVGPIHLGGVVRGGVSGSAFFQDALGTFALGFLFGLASDDPDGGPYGWLWFGPAYDYAYGFGFAAGIGAGYRWTLSDTFTLGLGGAVTTQWGFGGEDGDFGVYDYQHGSVAPTLELRMAYALEP